MKGVVTDHILYVVLRHRIFAGLICTYYMYSLYAYILYVANANNCYVFPKNDNLLLSTLRIAIYIDTVYVHM